MLPVAPVAVVVLRARTAPAEEVRRVMLFGSGFLLSAGLVALHDVIEAFTPGDWVSNYRWSPTAVELALLRFPGLALLWYSVLAVRVPHPREVVRVTGRRLLARGGLLGIAAALPPAALGWLVASRPERAVGAVLADPLVLSLGAATGLLLLVAGGRRWLLARLDAWVYPETVDQRQGNGRGGILAGPGGPGGDGPPGAAPDGEARVRLARHVAGEERCGWRTRCSPPRTAVAPLARASAIVHVLETVGGAMRVHRDDATSDFGMLPPPQRLDRYVALEPQVARQIGRPHPPAAQSPLQPVWGAGDGDAPGDGGDPRHRVVAGPAVPGGGVPAARHARGPAAAGAGAGAERGLDRRPPGRRARGVARGGGTCTGTVKPSNVGFTWRGSPKLLDFGLAHETDDPAPPGRHRPLPVAGGAVGPPGGGSR